MKFKLRTIFLISAHLKLRTALISAAVTGKIQVEAVKG